MRMLAILIGLSALLLSGCIEEKIAKRTAADRVLVDATASRLLNGKSCCASYRAMQFNQFMPGRHPISLDASSPIYTFAFGKSRFVAYSLPPMNPGDELIVGAIDLYSGSSARPRFWPTVLFLSDAFELLPNQPHVNLDDHFTGWSTEGHAAHIRLTPEYSEASYVIIAADPTFIGKSYVDRKHSMMIPAGAAFVSMSIPEQEFPYGYEGKGFIEIKHTSR